MPAFDATSLNGLAAEPFAGTAYRNRNHFSVEIDDNTRATRVVAGR